jgi:ADP-ribose pyrophosphatase YjhB (NUDIX family)
MIKLVVGERFRLRSAVYLILLKDNKVLFLRRFNTGWMDGKYSLVSGHLDGNETISQSLIREAFEEAKIKINKKDLIPATVIHRKSDFEYIDFFFIVKRWKGKAVIGEPDKCDKLEWFPLSNLPDNLLPFIKEAIENYKKRVPFFESGW